MTIREKVIKAINEYVAKNGYDTWMSRKEITEYINSCYKEKINYNSLLPPDYCYNRYNSGLSDFANKDRLLEYNDGMFKLLGENYPYTGDVWHYPSDRNIKPYIFGRWENGIFRLYSNSEVEDIKKEESFKTEATSIAVNIDRELDLHGLKGEERIAASKVRVNQSIYRTGLLRRYKTCCLCGVSNTNLLIASHIKPWSEAEAEEKLDFDNGLLLCPNHDKLFDQGYISFNDNGKIMISEELDEMNRLFVNVNDNMKLSLNRGNIKYMKYHREHIFKG